MVKGAGRSAGSGPSCALATQPLRYGSLCYLVMALPACCADEPDVLWHRPLSRRRSDGRFAPVTSTRTAGHPRQHAPGLWDFCQAADTRPLQLHDLVACARLRAVAKRYSSKRFAMDVPLGWPCHRSHLGTRISGLMPPAGYVAMLTGHVSNIAELGDLYSGAAKW
jgi:hypothetical protein